MGHFVATLFRTARPSGRAISPGKPALGGLFWPAPGQKEGVLSVPLSPGRPSVILSGGGRPGLVAFAVNRRAEVLVCAWSGRAILVGPGWSAQRFLMAVGAGLPAHGNGQV